VEASTEDLSLAYAYAAIDAGDDSTVTTVISNKSADQTQNAVISLEGSTKNYQSAVVYAITPNDNQIRIIDVQNDVSNNQVTVELPPMSVAQVVISDEESDAEIYVKPEEPETKTIVYNYSDLELSKNGFAMIPLEDLEHLKKIVLNITATCSSNSSWFGGGGALTFNQLLGKDGTTFWGAKAFGYSGGTNDVEVVMDDQFSNGDGDIVSATIQDTYTELQTEWWKSSTNDETGSDVTTVINTVSLVYEYEKTTTPSDTTTTTTETTTTETETTTSATETTSSETSTTTATSGGISPIFYGDVNLDGIVDLRDVINLNKYLCNIVELSDLQIESANVFMDGSDTINDDDVNTLTSFVIMTISEIPVQQ